MLSHKIAVLPLGVPDCFFTEVHELSTDNGLQMVFPAQFRYGKNQDVIIKAFAKHILNTGDHQSRLTLPGSGELLTDMKQLATNLGIANRVVFPGQCSKTQILQYYLQSNVGIIASNSETFGQSIVEPFVLGRCILTTPVGIAPDIISEGDGGFFFNSQEQLTELMGKLYETLSLLTHCGESNFKKSNQFNWATISKKYQELLYVLVS